MTFVIAERSIFMENLALVLFGIFLLILIVLDIAMIVSLLRTGDERRQLIVWKASAVSYTHLCGKSYPKRNAGRAAIG